MKTDLQNTFKDSGPVTSQQHQPVIPEDRRHDFVPKKLTPPVFEIATVETWNHNIAFSQTVQRVIQRGIKL